MGRKRRRLPPFEVEIEGLGKGGAGVGTAPDGSPVRVRPGPPGARLRVVPMGRKKGTWIGRRLAMIRPAAEGREPPCEAFGVCGGCVLQELGLAVIYTPPGRFRVFQFDLLIGPFYLWITR